MEMITEALNGNESAFAELYDLYAMSAFRLAKSITYNAESASDAVQEAFIRVFKSGKSFDSSKRFEPWFFKIVSNESKRQLKKHKDTVSFDLFTPEEIQSKHETEDIVALKESLWRLKVAERELLAYKYLLGYTESEISDIIKKPVGTVKSRIHNAKKKLKSFL